jgi:Putative prokaryotic signal transducing protein
MASQQTEWVEVRSCAFLHEAEFFKSLLEADGIDVFLPDEYTLGVDPGLAPGFGGVRILVRHEDLSRAREVLESNPKSVPSPNTR